jgi:hypothetical protein
MNTPSVGGGLFGALGAKVAIITAETKVSTRRAALGVNAPHV